jgi:hypothetical protein
MHIQQEGSDPGRAWENGMNNGLEGVDIRSMLGGNDRRMVGIRNRKEGNPETE